LCRAVYTTGAGVAARCRARQSVTVSISNTVSPVSAKVPPPDAKPDRN
jgi:hypothetical protein